MKLTQKISRIFKIIGIYCSERYATIVANKFWQNSTTTHGDMSETAFDFYYNELVKLIKPKKKDIILDYGGGNGEIAFRFKQNGYNIYHCDLSKSMVLKAREKFGLKSYECKDIEGKYDIILINNAFFYIHPKLYRKYLENLHNLLNRNGIVYITDTPDFEKRHYLKMGTLKKILIYFFPVYQIEMAGFFVKDEYLRKIAKETGFKTIERVNSWASYRSHWILKKS